MEGSFILSRRAFLQYSLLAMGALALPPLQQPGGATALPVHEPPIYRRFFVFTEYERRPATDAIVIHHTGFPERDRDATAAEIHHLHRDVNGWAGIGYHYLIRKDGMIEQGRLPDMVGAHALHHNRHALGVCLAGNFDIGRPTRAQMEAAGWLLAWLCQKYRLNPLQKGTIVGHRDYNDTSCPGANLYRRLGELRSAAAGRGRS